MSFWDPKKLEEERKRREDERRLKESREKAEKLARKRAEEKRIAAKKKLEEEHPIEYETYDLDGNSDAKPTSEEPKPSFPRLNRGLGGPLNQPVSGFKSDPNKKVETPLKKVAEAQKAEDKKEGSGDQQKGSSTLMRYVKW